MNLNIVAKCPSCDRQYVVFLPVGTGLTCGDCGAGKGFNCPACDDIVDFEAEPAGDVPTVIMAFGADGTTLESV